MNYNEAVLQNAINLNGVFTPIECPRCGERAEQRVFDNIQSGTVEEVTEVNCLNCGHHSCSDEWCKHCAPENFQEDEPLSGSQKFDILLGELLFTHEMEPNCCAFKARHNGFDPWLITELKHIANTEYVNALWFRQDLGVQELTQLNLIDSLKQCLSKRVKEI